jgi:hypothetical protein
MENSKKPLSNSTVFLMIFTALFFDTLQLLIGWVPVVGNIFADILSVFIFMTFFLWFMMNGISMITPKRLASMLGGGLIEMIPYVDLLPVWTGVVIYLIGTTKLKEVAAKNPTLAKGVSVIGGKVGNVSKNQKNS